MRLKTPDQSSSGRKGLFTDQAGATMVMGVFMAVLLVGMIYYVWGVGDAVMHRERMQDASDTAAFGAAVIHARGMNMLALLNMIMAALAFVAATMATIASMIGYAFAAASLMCSLCSPWCGWCCAQCPIAFRHGVEYRSASSTADSTESVIETLMTAVNGYAAGIRIGVPLAAQAKVVGYGTDAYAPVTELGLMLPLPGARSELPAQDDETNWPCDEKVLPWVRLLAPVYVWAFGSVSIYMPGGIFLGNLIDAPRHSRRWCQDGYFQRIIDDAQDMGNDRYQVQAYMLGDPDLEWTQEGVAIAAWGEGENAGRTYTNFAEMGRISFTQAEFFYDDGESDWREWLWHMNWRARLRRWRIEAAGGGGLGSCAFCAPLSAIGSEINDVVVH